MDGEGDGDTGGSSGGGRFNYVTRDECLRNVTLMDEKLDNIHLTLGGHNGRGGLVADVNYLKNRSHLIDKVVTFLVGIASSVLTTIIIWALGGL